MKRLLAVLLAAVLLASLAACTKQPNSGNGGDADMINPMVEYDTLDEINGVCGTALSLSALPGVTEPRYYVIGGDLADLRFDSDGIAFSFRGTKGTEDVSGIWVEGGTVFANEALSERPSVYEGDGFVTMRWLADGIQYVLTAQSDGVTYERVRGVMNRLAAGTIPHGSEYVLLEGNYADPDDPDIAVYIGTLGDSVYVFVNRMDTATAMTNWTMTARFDRAGKLVYEDCRCLTGSVDANGVYSETTVSENGRGWFTLERSADALLSGAVLRWDGAADETCRACVFERVTE